MHTPNDPYEIWMKETDDAASTPPPSPVAATVVAPPSVNRGYRIIGTILLVGVLAAGGVLWSWQRMRAARAEEHRREQARLETVVLGNRSAAQRAAEEVAVLEELARRQAANAGDPVRDREELATVQAALARAAAEVATARESVRIATESGATPAGELSSGSRRASAEVALVRVRAEVATIQQAMGTIGARDAVAREAGRLAERQAQAQAVEETKRQEADVLERSVNRTLVRSEDTLIVLLDDDQRPAWEAMDFIASRLRSAGPSAESRVLTPVFFTTPLARDLVEDGPAAVFPRLGINARRLIVGRIAVRATPPDQFGAITTDFTGAITVFDAAGRALGSVRWTGAGAAYDRPASAQQAAARSWNKFDWNQLTALLAP